MGISDYNHVPLPTTAYVGYAFAWPQYKQHVVYVTNSAWAVPAEFETDRQRREKFWKYLRSIGAMGGYFSRHTLKEALSILNPFPLLRFPAVREARKEGSSFPRSTRRSINQARRALCI